MHSDGINLFARLKALGRVGGFGRLPNAFKARLDYAGLSLLRILFGFERWHSASPNSVRPYRKQIKKLVDDLNPRLVVEVGCGLGGIVALVDAPRRLGIDTDARVIRAARFLRNRRTQFLVGTFDDVPDRQIDVLIAVNWLHQFSPEQVESWIKPLLPKVRHLLVDGIRQGSDPSYAYNHDFDFLESVGSCQLFPAAGEPHRLFYLWDISS